jgi:integrase
MSKRKYKAISTHPTKHGYLEVDWQREYNDEFRCPHCINGKLTTFIHSKKTPCKLVLRCKSCRKEVHLTCLVPGAERKHPPISTHPTQTGTLQVDWSIDYQGEFNCPSCQFGQLKYFIYQKDTICHLSLKCNSCRETTNLTCKVPAKIFNYCGDVICPNRLCNQIGPNGHRGWIYRIEHRISPYKCYFCGISFKLDSRVYSSWVGSQSNHNILPFCFDEDTWDLRNFYEKTRVITLNFQAIKSQWYRLEVKKYLYYLLKSGVYSSSSIASIMKCLRQFGQIVESRKLQTHHDISREIMLSFIDTHRTNKTKTVRQILSDLKNFLSWLGLSCEHLIRRRDLPKISSSDPNWLDEVTRNAIKQNLNKIPSPIARHYLFQEYTAARVSDVCQINIDCLVEENGKWYIRFYQQKVARWHQIPADREIRRVVEEQQNWIKQVLGNDYAYLFCHFRVISKRFYPDFPNMKPLPEPPLGEPNSNPMVRIIRLLIELENIRDANGQTPIFTGKITRSSRLQEIRVKHGIKAAQLYADHVVSTTTFQHYAPPTREQVASVDLPFQALLINPTNRFLTWQSLPESLLNNPNAHELDVEIAPRLVVYGHCALEPKTPCPYNLYPKCYGCGSFRPSTSKLPLYERQYAAEVQRMQSASHAQATLAYEEASSTVEAMDKWLEKLRSLVDG